MKIKKCENCVHFSGCFPAGGNGLRYMNTKVVAEICDIDPEEENILYWADAVA